MTDIDDADVGAMASLLKMTIEHAFGARRQVVALTELLIEKGVVAEAEILEKMRSTDDQTGQILLQLQRFADQWGKPS